MRKLSLLALIVALAVPSLAQAHFVFLVIAGGNAPQARAYFAESAEPDKAALIKKITQSKGWVRGVQGEPQPLVWQEVVEGENGWLAAKLEGKAGAVEAECRYGVITRGAPFLLFYYAKALNPANAEELPALARGKNLKLDVVPAVADGTLNLTVLWNGQPLAGSELVVIDPESKHHEVKTDANGKASVPAAARGLYAARAKHVEADKGGEETGTKYNETRHYSTVTLNLPAGTPLKAAEAKPAEAK